MSAPHWLDTFECTLLADVLEALSNAPIEPDPPPPEWPLKWTELTKRRKLEKALRAMTTWEAYYAASKYLDDWPDLQRRAVEMAGYLNRFGRRQFPR